MRFLFPESWYVTVTVAGGQGGFDRWGNPVPGETREVTRCVLAPRQPSTDETLGAWTDTDGMIYHESERFAQGDILTVPDGPNSGDWEVQSPSAGWPFGTETRVRRVNQRED